MAYLRLALAQMNPCVGDISGNAKLIVEWCRQASDADLVLFPEMALTGYPVDDLALRDTVGAASRQGIVDVAERLYEASLGDLVVVVGYLDHAAEVRGGESDRRPVNAAAVLHRGEVICRLAKRQLSDDDSFDETRLFATGTGLTVIRVSGIDVALAIGDDLSAPDDRVAAAREAGAGVLSVINASPYDRDGDTRADLITRRARDAGCSLAYVNAVGGQGEIVFDGASTICDADGVILSQAARFTESLDIVDLDVAPAPHDAGTGSEIDHDATPIHRYPISEAHSAPGQPRLPRVAIRDPVQQETYQALLLALRDYLVKNGFRRVVLGLSGGIDSALVATLACDAIGASNVRGISNPSEISPEHARTDAAELADRTGLELLCIPIAGMVAAFADQLPLEGVTGENLQARIRGVIWMAESNRDPGSIVLACGNRSEGAVGYSTLYGDAVGGFAPIKDVPKTWVWQLASWRNEHAARRGETPPIPQNTITKEPSAELRPGQRDSDSLPPYQLLDDILDSVDRGRGRSDLEARGFDPELIDRVISMVDAAEYKRRQYPPGTRIRFRPVGRDRRLPIANRWREADR